MDIFVFYLVFVSDGSGGLGNFFNVVVLNDDFIFDVGERDFDVFEYGVVLDEFFIYYRYS